MRNTPAFHGTRVPGPMLVPSSLLVARGCGPEPLLSNLPPKSTTGPPSTQVKGPWPGASSCYQTALKKQIITNTLFGESSRQWRPWGGHPLD